MSSAAKKIEGTLQAWEDEKLGDNARYARVSSADQELLVDQALGLHMISIRLENELISVLKAIAEVHGIGYQPLIRDVLNRFASAEAKRLLMKYKCTLKEEESVEEDCEGNSSCDTEDQPDKAAAG